MKIMDVGETFGLSGFRVFKKWKPQVIVPNLLKDVEQNLAGVDFVILGGGADIHPSLYGQKPGYGANAGPVPSRRDNFEVQVFKLCQKMGIPIFGICRGAQMVCALTGGQLFQHVNNHAGRDHYIKTSDGKKYMSTSVHHQMMCPTKTKHELIAWAEGLVTSCSFDPNAKMQQQVQEPEIVYFPGTASLAVQGHPEFVADLEEPFVKYCRNLVATKLLARPDLVEEITLKDHNEEDRRVSADSF